MTKPRATSEPQMLRVDQVAERWACSEGMVRKVLNSGRLSHFRIGRMIRIPLTDLEAYEQQCRVQATNRVSSKPLAKSSGRSITKAFDAVLVRQAARKLKES